MLIWIAFLATLWSGAAWPASDAGYCPRLEGKRSGTCRIEQSGILCEQDQPCGSQVIKECLEPSTFDMPMFTGGTCVSMEERCTVTPEGRTCEQVCTKWDHGTCAVHKIPCCRKFKDMATVPMKCCGGECRPVGPGGTCGEPPPAAGTSLRTCGADGGCG